MNDNFFESLKQTLTDTAEAVGKKTEDVLEVQKLRSKISNAKKNVEVDYKKLGMIIYQRYLSGETLDEELVTLCDAIGDLMKQAEQYQEELADKKGIIICNVCSSSNPKDAFYCMKCGNKLPVKVQEPEEEDDWVSELDEEDAEAEEAVVEETEVTEE